MTRSISQVKHNRPRDDLNIAIDADIRAINSTRNYTVGQSANLCLDLIHQNDRALAWPDPRHGGRRASHGGLKLDTMRMARGHRQRTTCRRPSRMRPIALELPAALFAERPWLAPVSASAPRAQMES